MYSRKGWIHLCEEERKKRGGEVGRRRGREDERWGEEEERTKGGKEKRKRGREVETAEEEIRGGGEMGRREEGRKRGVEKKGRKRGEVERR